MTIPAITDFRARADALLISQYRNSPKLQILYRMVCDELQRQNADMQDLLLLRMLDAATGLQLDGLGDILGVARAGRLDAEYQAALSVQVLINRSGGQPETIITVIETLAAATIVQLIYRQPATLEVWHNGLLDLEYVRYFFTDAIDETTNIITDERNNVDALVINATYDDITIKAANDGRAVVFDANNEIIKLDSAITSKKTSVSLWYYCDAFRAGANYNILFSNYVAIAGNVYYLGVDIQGRLYFNQDNAGATNFTAQTAIGTIATGNLYHIVLTCNDSDSTVKIYVNGVKKTLVKAGIFAKLSDYGVRAFGNTIETDTNRHANGKIGGELRIFNWILTQDEVDYLYLYAYAEKFISNADLLVTVQKCTAAGVNLLLTNASTGNPLTMSEYDAGGNIPDPTGEGLAEYQYSDDGGNISELYNEV